MSRDVDPRARFVELQLERDRTGGYPTEEERALLELHWRDWIGAPSEILTSAGAELARGRWEAATYFDFETIGALADASERARIVEAASWATVERLVVQDFVSAEWLRAMLSGPLRVSVRAIGVGSLSALGELASWRGPPLDVHTLKLLYDHDADAPFPTDFGGLPRLERMKVHVIADSMATEVARATSWLAAGPCGPEGRVREVSLSVFPHVRNDTPLLRSLLGLVDRSSSPALRVIELFDTLSNRVRIERDDAGGWTKLRMSTEFGWGQRHLTEYEIDRLAVSAARLPKGRFDVVLEVPLLEMRHDAEGALERLTAQVAQDGVTVERTPAPPRHPPWISPAGSPSRW